jgi:hypothetical protein
LDKYPEPIYLRENEGGTNMVKIGILSSILAGYPPPQYQQPPPPQPAPPPPQPAPAPLPAPKKGGKPWILPFVFAIIAVVFILLSLIGPWQTLRVEGEVADEDIWMQADYGLQSITMTASEDLLYEPDDENYEDPTDQVTYYHNDKYEDGGMNDDVEDGGSPAELAAWNTCFYLTILAFIMAILMLVFVLIAGTKGNPKLGKLAMIFALLALIFGLLTPIYAAAGIPAAREADWDELDTDEDIEHNSWWESWDEEGTDFTLGAGWGWYLCLIGGIMALLGLIFIMKMNKSLKADQPAPAAPPPAPAPAPQYQQPPQQQW